ncbi:putative F-box domain, FBD domain, leucine-rich repeat domain superfamily [Arabidopsis thaliana]
MDSAKNSDFFSNLHDSLLVFIISMLPFKDLVRTSVLSRRWRYLCRETTSLVFNESDFVNLSVFDREMVEPDRIFFVRVMREWISRFTGDIMSLTEFATSRQVKNLVLDFSDPIQRNLSQAQQIIRDGLLRCRYPQKNELDVSHLFFNLLYVRNLTVCSFFLQVLQDCDDPMALHDSMKTRHLVMKTNMHANDFVGISIFLNSCPELESLTFDLVTSSRFVRAPSPLVIDPVSHWLTSKPYECLEKTLKVVKITKFRGSSNELHMLQYLLRTGCVMERVDLYEAEGLNHNQKRWVLAGVEEVQQNFKRASRHLRITLHNA